MTGFAIQKFLDPNTQLDLSGGGGIPNPAYPLIRMADLYLMLAECQANLSSDGKSDTYATEALKNLNAVHQRAGLKAITKEDLTDMPLMEWIKNERYVEFYAEGQRYFDVNSNPQLVQAPGYGN